MRSGFLLSLRTELRSVYQLAWPLVLAELGWTGETIVDTIMVGRVGAAAVAGVSLGAILFFTVSIFGFGILLGLDTLVSQAYGAGNRDDCRKSMLNGLYLSAILAGPLMLLTAAWPRALSGFGIHPDIIRETIPYLHALNWSAIPLLLFTVFRRYLQGMDIVKPIMFALISANLINAAGNWILIWGHFGAPAMGAEGAGWSTTISRWYMVGMLAAVIATGKLGPRFEPPDFARIRQLVRLGLPAALQITVEVGVFAAATALIGKLDPVSAAAHQIALSTVSTTFMVPLGISSAAAVRVGQALGRRDAQSASRSGWTAVALGAAFMTCAAIALMTVPEWIARIYTPDPPLIRTAAALLFVAAFFQLFDGLQIVTTGALRGAGDTRTPMICHLAAYWGIGLPLGYYLCFHRGWAATGLWTGLCLALILIGVVLLYFWWRTAAGFGCGETCLGRMSEHRQGR